MDLRKWVEGHIADNNWTKADMAREVGIGRSRLVAWLDGKYEGDQTRIEETIRAYQRRALGTVSSKFSIPLQQTQTFLIIQQVCEICRTTCQMGLVKGNSGVGKTFAIDHYRRQHIDEVVKLTANPRSRTRHLMQTLARSVNIRLQGASSDAVMDEIVEYLKSHPLMVIIDEANHLGFEDIENFRYIHDLSGAPILFVSTPKIDDRLFRVNSRAYHDLEQVRSRITAANYRLKGLASKEIANMLATFFPKTTSKIHQKVADFCGDSFRHLRTICFNASAIAQSNARERIQNEDYDRNGSGGGNGNDDISDSVDGNGMGANAADKAGKGKCGKANKADKADKADKAVKATRKPAAIADGGRPPEVRDVHIETVLRRLKN